LQNLFVEFFKSLNTIVSVHKVQGGNGTRQTAQSPGVVGDFVNVLDKGKDNVACDGAPVVLTEDKHSFYQSNHCVNGVALGQTRLAVWHSLFRSSPAQGDLIGKVIRRRQARSPPVK
jgi:hypothetical protein